MDAPPNLLTWYGRLLAIGYTLLWSTTALLADEPQATRSNQAAPEIRNVTAEQAKVHAGPSDDFYPTSHLKQGDSVEVYKRTGDGWLAIRPPQGSFSWLPAAQGLLLPGGRVVEVVDKSAVSWIGSSLGTAKQYRWQVRLDRGQQLAIIGEQTLTNEQDDKKTLWYKITPPSGEFRWIREHDTAPSDENSVTQTAARGTSDGEATNDDQLPGDHSVLAASAEEPTGDVVQTTGMTRKRDHQQPYASGRDRWADWHAMEFKNGSFSFPGIARMFGREPSPDTTAHATYDPFDLTAPAHVRPRNAQGAEQRSEPEGVSSAVSLNDSSGTPLMAQRPRGWRDPRQIREARNRANDEASQSLSAGESSYAASIETSADTVANLSTAFLDNAAAVGTGVVTASAPSETTTDSMNSLVNDTSWYGIHQAPQLAASTPLDFNAADLDEVQLRLSEIVAGPEHTWNLAPLADRTRYLIEHGPTAIERGEARLLLDRIEAFANLARRSTELGMTPPVSLPATVNASLSSSPIAAAAARWVTPLGVGAATDMAASGNAPRFDATGWIVPVHTSGRDMPTHALTNDSGKIIVYLTPAAGVNLARYQGQAVGVYGLRGYLPQLKTNHIQVQRAVRLQ